MKKFLSILVLVFCCLFTSYGQGLNFTSENFKTETVDEFGDNTGDIKVGIHAKGYFSNSATTNSCAELIISFMKDKSPWVSLYEYCSNSSSKELYKITWTGTTTNETIITGDYLISLKILDLFKDNDVIKIKMIERTEYGTPTTAVFKLYKGKEFYNSYISEFGVPEKYEFYNIGGQFLEIYSKPSYDKNPNDIFIIKFNTTYEYLGRTYQEGMSIDGKFKNGKYISIYGKSLYIDNEFIQKGKYDYQYKLDNILQKLHIGAKIKVTSDDGLYTEEFILSEKQYNAILDFYKK